MRDTGFSGDQLLAMYGRVAGAEDAIPQLRRFVLDLAVRGKLVSQDAADEPASELLKRIEVARQATPAQGRKSTKRRASDDLAKLPFELPCHWATCALGGLVRVINGRAYKKQELLDEGTPVLRVGNLFTSKHWYYSDLELDDDKYCDEGDLIYAWSASFGPFIWDGPRVIYHYHIWKLELFSEADLDRDFLYLFLLQKTREIKDAGHGISMIHMTKEKMEQLAVPLPPLAEQHRVVAKVAELMGLLDQLEQTRARAEGVRARLTTATWARLTSDAADAPQTARHTDFALKTLPALTTTPTQIKTLRQTILNLAVRGKLVAQDPEDEPASVLLERIAREIPAMRSRLGLRPQAAREEVDAADAPFNLPAGWSWARFPEVGVFARGKSKHRPRNDVVLYRDGTIPFVQTGDIARSSGLITTHSGVYNEVGLRQSLLWPAGTMCITIAANIADSGILTFDACFPDSVVGLLVAPCFENARYFEYFVRTAKANLTEFAPATAQKNINLGILETVLIPLPPLAEQHRIVAKVDALMALCDQLETALTTTATTRQRLLETLIRRALSPDDPIPQAAQ